jgi:hypothetical protein
LSAAGHRFRILQRIPARRILAPRTSNRKAAFGRLPFFSRRPVSGVFSRFTAQALSGNAERHKKLGDNAVFKNSGAGHNEIAIRYRRLLF